MTRTNSDTYYAMYRQNDEGTCLLHRRQSREGWGTRPVVHWRSSAGNIARFTFDHDEKQTVTLFINSRRDGIPALADGLKDFVPAKIFRYETQERDWRWHESAYTRSVA